MAFAMVFENAFYYNWMIQW